MSRVLSARCESFYSFIHSTSFSLTNFNFSIFRTAVDALIQSGYQPSRTLVFSLMLGEVRHVFCFHAKK